MAAIRRTTPVTSLSLLRRQRPAEQTDLQVVESVLDHLGVPAAASRLLALRPACRRKGAEPGTFRLRSLTLPAVRLWACSSPGRGDLPLGAVRAMPARAGDPPPERGEGHRVQPEE